MKVIIREKEYEYESDFDNGWQFAAGDYFKFPVKIGSHRCFIKRFAKKNPEMISGWQLLRSLKGKYSEQNISRIHDIVQVREKTADVFYVFFEFLEGETLDRHIHKSAPFDLERLTSNLFSAIQSLEKKEYWFADFCEKNIFCEKKGGFSLLDLDSAQPVSNPPDNDMYGDKQYWSSVFNFYTNICEKKIPEPAEIPGLLLNYLMICFLILRLKIFFSEEDLEYISPTFLDSLPSRLHLISPDFKSIFNKLYNERNDIKPEDIDTIKNLILKKIVNPSPPSPPPIIEEFTIVNLKKDNANIYLLEDQREIVIHWSVSNADKIELHKNSEFYRLLGNEENNVRIVYDRTPEEKISQYTLIASNSSDTITSNPLSVKFISLIPSVSLFKASKEVVEEGETFTLSWDVKNMDSLALYKDGQLETDLEINEENIDVSEKAPDGKEKTVEYRLEATSKTGITKSAVLKVRIKAVHKNEKLPSISLFKASKEVVEEGEIFTLSWNAKNMDSLALYKDGQLETDLEIGEKNIDISERAPDGKERTVEYRLEATNKTGITKSAVLKVRIKAVDKKDELPDISLFKASKKVVKDGETFTFSWNVKNMDSLALYKDGQLETDLEISKKNIDVSERVSDGKERTVEYQLEATNKTGKIRSDTFKVKVTPVTLPPPDNGKDKTDNKEKNKKRIYIIGAAIILFIAILMWVVLPRLNNDHKGVIVLTDTTKNISDSTSIFSQPLSPNDWPLLLNEIWQEGQTNRLVNINLSQHKIYYGEINKKGYATDSIIKIYKNDSSIPGGYRIIAKAEAGFKLLYVRNVSAESFELFACPGFYKTEQEIPIAHKTDCNEQKVMHEYYDKSNNNSQVYLPVNSQSLAVSEKEKLASITDSVNLYKSSGKMKDYDFSYSLKLFNNTTFIEPSNFSLIDNYFSGLPVKLAQTTEENTALVTNNPFIRNYFTFNFKITRKQPGVEEYSPDCAKTFRSIGETQRLKSPLIVCKLDLSATKIDKIPDEVYSFKNIRELNIGANPISGNEVNDFKRRFPLCKVLSSAPSGSNETADETVKGADLGYIVFDSNHDLDDASEKRLEQIANELNSNRLAKLKFNADWDNEDEKDVVGKNVTALINGLKGLDVKMSNDQMDTKATQRHRQPKNVNRIYLTGINFSPGFK